jgi:murein DD-endopeptidase MepM/ murein hydrolase activator NlpD
MTPLNFTPLFLGLFTLVLNVNGDHPEWGPYPPVAPMDLNPLPSEHVVLPLIFPIIGVTRWHDSYNENRGKFRHSGIDIAAPKMSPIVAPFSGTLGMKDDSFWIYGDNGWITLGTHLNDDNLGKHDHKGGWDAMFSPNIVAGMHVEAGQFLGYVGESGDATGPHLHFEIYAPGTGSTFERIRDPFPSLKMSQFLKQPRAVLPDASDVPGRGEFRWQGSVRKIDRSKHLVTLILSGKQGHDGFPVAVTQVRYMRFKVPDDMAEKLGGWDRLENLTRAESLAVYVRRSAKKDPLPRRIEVSSPVVARASS